METQFRSWFNGQTVLGLAILLMGVLFLLDNASVIEIGSVWKYWPLILVAAGFAKLVNENTKKGKIEGAWLAFIGIWLFFSFNHIFGLSFRTSWPLLIIAWGVTMLWKEVIKPSSDKIMRSERHGQ